jgi:hypothetical protein
MTFAKTDKNERFCTSMKRTPGASGGVTVDEIAYRYREFVNVFESARVETSAV